MLHAAVFDLIDGFLGIFVSIYHYVCLWTLNILMRTCMSFRATTCLQSFAQTRIVFKAKCKKNRAQVCGK